jgi:hypothetical protein
MNRSNISWRVWLYALVLATALSLPHIVALANTPDGWQYSGALVLPDGFRVDYNSHIAKMWQGARGEFAYQLLFTHEEHPGLPTVQGFYVALGAIAGVLGLGFALTYHIARIVLTVTMILALWRFAWLYFDDARGRWLALIFGTLVTGWGWLLFFVAPLMSANVAPIEFWLIDAYNAIGALYMPHFAAAITLQLVAFVLYEQWRKRPNPRHIILLTLVLLVDAIIQPYVVLLTFPLFGLLTAYHVFISKTLALRHALFLIVPALAHGGIVVYQYLAIAGHPIWADFTAQNLTLSPAPLYYVMGYLPFLLVMLVGGGALVQVVRADSRWLLPVLWVALVMILLYLPLPTQRRYLLGVQSPLAILTAYAWIHGVQARFGKRLSRNLLIPVLALSMIAPLLLLTMNSLSLANPQTSANQFYTDDERTAAQWIRQNTDRDALILTTFDTTQRGTGGAVVALTGRRVFIGHWIETAAFNPKQAQLARFYDTDSDRAWRRAFLRDIDADYVWYDTEARTYGDWSPATADYLRPVIETERVILYEVQS